jgi:hypothetical protein
MLATNSDLLGPCEPVGVTKSLPGYLITPAAASAATDFR